MKLLFDDIFLRHLTGSHPECPQRLEAFGALGSMHFPDAEEWLTLVHEPDYVHQVKDACVKGGYIDQDTIVSPQSYQAAIMAVSATIEAEKNGDFALVRPPGHHSYPDHSSGFCLFNSIAIAAKKLANEGKKVLIFDFDGHLGDGTSFIFRESNQVLYWSLHQYPAFPHMGFVNEIGTGKGEGFTINVPLPPLSGDDIFLDAFQKTLEIAIQFEPDVVAISAGFDAHQFDPLLNLLLSATCFHTIGSELIKHFPHLFATLEGGYNLNYLPKCTYNFIGGVNGQSIIYYEPATESTPRVWEEYNRRMDRLFSNLGPFWKL